MLLPIIACNRSWCGGCFIRIYFKHTFHMVNIVVFYAVFCYFSYSFIFAILMLKSF